MCVNVRAGMCECGLCTCGYISVSGFYSVYFVLMCVSIDRLCWKTDNKAEQEKLVSMALWSVSPELWSVFAVSPFGHTRSFLFCFLFLGTVAYIS